MDRAQKLGKRRRRMTRNIRKRPIYPTRHRGLIADAANVRFVTVFFFFLIFFASAASFRNMKRRSIGFKGWTDLASCFGPEKTHAGSPLGSALCETSDARLGLKGLIDIVLHRTSLFCESLEMGRLFYRGIKIVCCISALDIFSLSKLLAAF